MKILCDPAPRELDEIFNAQAKKSFFSRYDVIEVTPDNREAQYAEHLPDCEVLISQQLMDQARIDTAKKLRAIINVETNFLPNIDYERCFERGIHVLAPSAVFAVPVAEMGLGMALSLARDIAGGYMDFVAAKEKYGLAANEGAELLTNNTVGIIGYGDLGRAIHKLLNGFHAEVSVYDPWLPEGFLRQQYVRPVSFEALLKTSRFVFVTASITTENQHMIDAEALAKMPDGAKLILLSRAQAVDFAAMKAEAQNGRLLFATDVFPEEPVASDDPIRQVPNILFSAHKAGALTSALEDIGNYVLDDLSLIARGLPPVRCKRAQRESVGKLRSKPVDGS